MGEALNTKVGLDGARNEKAVDDLWIILVRAMNYLYYNYLYDERT